MGNKLHLDRDPNDPRLNKPAESGFTLNDVPEAEATPVARFKVKGENFIQNVGVDPNDPRARKAPELVSLD